MHFYLEPNGLAMDNRFELLPADEAPFDLSLGRSTGAYAIAADVKDDGKNVTSIAQYKIGDDWRALETKWVIAVALRLTFRAGWSPGRRFRS
ncbi:MAG: hypothetical protein HPY59_01600 [Anaerolineae bacterium]|nr:hypothetical protein [Anaerolineae bacterium]